MDDARLQEIRQRLDWSSPGPCSQGTDETTQDVKDLLDHVDYLKATIRNYEKALGIDDESVEKEMGSEEQDE